MAHKIKHIYQGLIWREGVIAVNNYIHGILRAIICNVIGKGHAKLGVLFYKRTRFCFPIINKGNKQSQVLMNDGNLARYRESMRKLTASHFVVSFTWSFRGIGYILTWQINIVCRREVHWGNGRPIMVTKSFNLEESKLFFRFFKMLTRVSQWHMR